jgi:hypothetical protein
VQVIHMLKGVSCPGPAFQLDTVRGGYRPVPGVHLNSSSHGSARALLLRFAATATAVRRVQAFCSAAVRAGGGASGSVAGGGADEVGEGQGCEEHRLHSLPTVAAFAAAVAEQQQGLQQQLLVVETAFSSGALLSLLQLQQRTACLAEQAGVLAALSRRCCCWRGSPVETSAALLTELFEALQLQLLQARSQGEPATASQRAPCTHQCEHGFGVQQMPNWQPGWGGQQQLMPLQCSCLTAWLCVRLNVPLQAACWQPCCCGCSPRPAAPCWRHYTSGCTAAYWTILPLNSSFKPVVRPLALLCFTCSALYVG